MLDESLMFTRKRGGEVAVDIEFSHHFAVGENRYYDLGFGLERTGKVARIFADVIDHDSLSAGSRRAANPLVQGNAGMRRHGAFKRAQHQYGRLCSGSSM